MTVRSEGTRFYLDHEDERSLVAVAFPMNESCNDKKYGVVVVKSAMFNLTGLSLIGTDHKIVRVDCPSSTGRKIRSEMTVVKFIEYLYGKLLRKYPSCQM